MTTPTTTPTRLSAEMTGTLATRAAIKAHGGSLADPDSIYRAAMYALDALAGRGDLDEEDARISRATALARYWQGYGVAGVGPDRYTRRSWWAGEFRRHGWVHLWERTPRPSALLAPRSLYRGSPPARRDGMAWTPDRAVAEWFAAQCGGVVHEITPPATERFLAAFPVEVVQGLVGTEYVIDAAGLDIREARG